MSLQKIIALTIAILVAFSISVTNTSGMPGVTVDHGEIPGLGGGHDKAELIQSGAKNIGRDRIQLALRKGAKVGNAEPLP